MSHALFVASFGNFLVWVIWIGAALILEAVVFAEATPPTPRNRPTRAWWSSCFRPSSGG